VWEKTLTSRSINFKSTGYKAVVNRVSTNALDYRRQQLTLWLHQCRIGTLALFEGVDSTTFCRQAHQDFSPAGWHLGHIAYIESLWLLERSAGIRSPWAEYRQLFAADGLPKTQRVNLPSLAEVRYYVDTVREQVLNYLTRADLDQQERLWRWLIQHESQHSEIIAFVLQLQRWDAQSLVGIKELLPRQERHEHVPINDMVEIPAGYFEQGDDSIDALDNERPAHQVYLEAYSIDRYPVTCGQYRVFIEAEGYQNHIWWSEAGWKWLQSQMVTQPLYWTNNPAWDDHPVYGINWYEAEAYARFVGKRLPTEAEWEKAASWDADTGCRHTYTWGKKEPVASLCNYAHLGEDSYPPLQTTPVDTYPTGQSAYGCYDMLGNVWEWTASAFHGYQGFASYPYAGYSKVYFDGEHRVLKGGSWATRPWALRCSSRNWYHPGVRQIIAGLRCARSASL